MQFAADRLEAPTAIRTDLGAIFISLELSRSSWVVTSLSPGGGEKMSKHTVRGGDVAGLLKRFAQLREKAKGRTGKVFPLIVIQEAGLDGFWIDRVLQNEGIESHVVDPASIATSRRRRRAKTDGIDGEALVRALLAYKRGEPRVCSMVRLPTPEDEDRRRLCRERKVLIMERVQHVNRIKGLLFSRAYPATSRYVAIGGSGWMRCRPATAGPCPCISKRRFVANLIGLSCCLRRLRLWRPSGMRYSPWNKLKRRSRRRCCWA